LIPASTEPKAGWLFWGLFGLLIVVGIYAQLVLGLKPNDDNLWLAYSVDKILDRVAGDALENQVIDAVRKSGGGEEAIFRLTLRRDTDTNYRLTHLTWAAFDRLLLSRIEDYQQRTTFRLTVALLPVLLLPWLIFGWLLMTFATPAVRIAAAFVLTWFALISLVDAFQSTFVPFTKPNLLSAFGHLFFFMLNPEGGFNIFNFTPRNILTVLVAGALIARWHARDRVGYLLLALAVGVHTAVGAMVLASIIIGDVVLARERLRDPIAAALVALSSIYVVLNERIFAMVSPGVYVFLGASALAALPVMIWWIFADKPGLRIPYLRPPLEWIATFRSRWRTPFVVQDVVVFLFVFAALTITSAVMLRFAPSISVRYFWGQLPTRLFSAVGPAVLIGIGALLLGERAPSFRPAAVAVMTMTIAAGLPFYMNKGHPMTTFEKKLEAVGEELEKQSATQTHEERLIYYSLGRAILHGQASAK